MKKCLRITADDMGYSTERDKGIVTCFKKKAITRASVLVNGASAKHAIDLAKEHKLPIGLHLNLTEGRPISTVDKVPTLVTSQGFMLGKMGFRKALQKDEINLDEVCLEMANQIKYFTKMADETPAYVDGHQHVHVLPGIAGVFAKALQKEGITFTRLPFEPAISSYDYVVNKNSLEFIIKVSQQAQLAAKVFDAHKIRYDDSFVGMATMGSEMTIKRLQDQISAAFDRITNVVADIPKRKRVSSESSGGPDSKHHKGDVCNVSSDDTTEKQKDDKLSEETPSGAGGDNKTVVSDHESDNVTCELMCHPGYPCTEEQGGCGEGPDNFARSHDRQHEMNILCSSDMLDFYEKSNLFLIC